MKNSSVLETRKVGDFIYRHRQPDKGFCFWTIEYKVSEDVPPEVKAVRNEQKRQERLKKAHEKAADLPENAEERK